MKRTFILLFLTGIVSISTAQTLGLTFNPAIDLERQALKPYFGPSVGLYYDQAIWRAIGFSTGILFTQVRSGHYRNGPPEYTWLPPVSPIQPSPPFYSQVQFTRLIEIPCDFTFMFNKDLQGKCRVYYKLGYAYGQIFEQQTAYYTGGRENSFSKPSHSAETNAVRTGLEARYDPIPRVNLAFGLQYRYMATFQPMGGPYNQYNLLSAYIKTGLNFLGKKGKG